VPDLVSKNKQKDPWIPAGKGYVPDLCSDKLGLKVTSVVPSWRIQEIVMEHW
jgi:hypothetical protein